MAASKQLHLSDLKRRLSRTAKSLSLSDIDGSLANANICSRSFVIRQTCAHEHFTFACTCFLYYNLRLCKSFKERAPEESALKVSHPIREAASPHLRVQRYAFSANWQNISRLFSKKDAFYAPIHYIYNTREETKEKRQPLNVERLPLML